jgi:hypothetical protein
MDGQTYPGSGDKEESRSPEKSDLSKLCRELNRVGAKYIVVGGFAVIQAGLPRLTVDIDLLIDTSLENESLVFEALRILPDKAVNQLDPGDVSRFTVVRVADEVVVDLMAKACGVDYSAAILDANYSDIEGVSAPFASPRTLLKMKQTVREKDAIDRRFLKQLIAATENSDEPDESKPGFLAQLKKNIKGE